MSPRTTIPVVIIIILVFVGFNSLFTVHQTQHAILLQFGDPINEINNDPGLHFKLPFVQNVIYLDNRLLDLDSRPEEVIAADQERLVVDAFAKFQIVSPVNFYEAIKSESEVRVRLAQFLNSNMRRVLGSVSSTETISGARASLMNQIQAGVNAEAERAGFGIVVSDVRIRRADLPAANSQAVYERMQSERRQEAAQFRAEGEERARRIRAQAERMRTVIVARAREEGEIKRGQGDAFRNAIFACSFGADPEFFAFYRSMQAYEESFQSQDTTMVLSPDSDFFQFFGNPAGDPKAPVSENEASVSGAAQQSSDSRCSEDGSYNLDDVDFLMEGTTQLEVPLEIVPAELQLLEGAPLELAPGLAE
jgi:membrane protease subunit HflC